MSQELAIADSQDKAKRIFDNLDVSEATRKDYSYRIGVFLQFIQERGLNRNSFLEFKRTLAARTDLSVSTKNKYLVTARIFLKELNRLGFLPADLTQNIKSFSQNRKHKKDGLTQEEVARLVGRINATPDTPKNLRLKAMFCLLAFNGLREIEVVRLDINDIDLANKTALIRGKGMDDKEIVYLSPDTARIIRRHMEANKNKSGALFRSLGNRKSERLDTRTVQYEIGGLFEELGIEKTVHGLRHQFVTALLDKMDVRTVRKFSRHRNLESIITYDDALDLKARASEVFAVFENLKIA